MHKHGLVLLSPGTGLGESFSSRHNSAAPAVWQGRGRSRRQEQEAGAGARSRTLRSCSCLLLLLISVLRHLCDHLPRKIIQLMRIVRRLHYWWSLFVAGALLLICGPPILSVAWLTG